MRVGVGCRLQVAGGSLRVAPVGGAEAAAVGSHGSLNACGGRQVWCLVFDDSQGAFVWEESGHGEHEVLLVGASGRGWALQEGVE